jgi:hypothetical protein
MTPVRCGEDVDTLLGDEARRRTGLGRTDRRLAEERCPLDRGHQLAAELAKARQLRAIADQTERGGVPEGGGAAIGQDDLVAIRHRVELRDAATQPRHLVLDGLLPV